jgi:predicted hydrocarbon binding protein
MSSTTDITAQESERRYPFSWDLLGDLEQGRPNLGPQVRLEIYRLLLFSFRDVLEQHVGTDETDRIIYGAGRLAGEQVYEHLIGDTADFEHYIARLQQVLRETGVGILRLEESDLEAGRLVLTVSEDTDCSGLPDSGDEICVYDEGFIAALLESFTGRPFKVTEVDCWCSGDRTCRFVAEADDEATE